MPRYIFLFLFVLLSTAVFSQQVTVDAVLDTAKMRIGEQARVDIYLSYTANKNIKVEWPSIGDTLTEKIEVVSVSPIDTTFPDKSNSTKMLQHQQVTISVYDSGYYAIPGFKFVVNGDSLHPLYTKPMLLEVHTVPTDTSAAKTKDIKPPFNEPFNWKWYISYVYVMIGILAVMLVLMLASIYYARRRRDIVIEPEKPKVPAHILALSTLEQIREDQVWKDGRIKEYYSAISDTVRMYIEDRFAVHALESTTDEIMSAFRTQVVDKESKDKLQQMLMLSDLVKFAKLFPVETEHVFTLQNAFDFVNGTKRDDEVFDEATNTVQPKVNYSTAKTEAPPKTVYQAPVPEAVANGSASSEKSVLVQLNSEPPKKASPGRTALIITATVLGFLLVIILTYYLVTSLVKPASNTANASTESSAAPEDFDSVLQQTANELNKKCPLMLDPYTRLDSVAASVEEKTIRYYYTLVTMAEGQVDVEALKSQIRPAILNVVKTNPEMKPIREQSGSLEYYYNDKNGKRLFIIAITPPDYLN